MRTWVSRTQRRIWASKAATSSVLIRRPAHYYTRGIYTSYTPPPTTFTIYKTLGTVCGISATAFGIYTLYASHYSIWPSVLRKDIRPGVGALHEGDLVTSERHLRRAWNTCRTIPRIHLGHDPWLKLSSTASMLGEVLEGLEQPERAYEVYAEFLGMFQAADEQLGVADRYRAAVVAAHSSELANALGKREDAENWCIWRVEESVRLDNSSREHADYTPVYMATHPLPDWIFTGEAEAQLVTLGSSFAKRGKMEAALIMNIHAADILLNRQIVRRPSDRLSPQYNCQVGRALTNAIGMAIIVKPPSMTLDHLKDFATVCLRGIGLIKRTHTHPDCERLWVTILFQLGTILKLQSKPEAARKHFEQALSHAKSLGMLRTARKAEDALAGLSSVRDPEDRSPR